MGGKDIKSLLFLTAKDDAHTTLLLLLLKVPWLAQRNTTRESSSLNIEASQKTLV